MGIDLRKVFPNLQYSDGILYSNNEQITHYPNDGNELFSQIEDQSFWYIHRNSIILNCIQANNHNAKKTFLEIGAGNGYVSAEIKHKTNLEIIALEPDNFGAKFILERGLKHVICSQFDDDTALPNSFDNIGIFDVLEHIENDAKFISAIHATLKDDGTIYLTVPAYKWLWSIEDEHDKHFRRYTKKNIIKLLQKNEFKVVYSSYFFLFLPLPIFLLRAVSSFFHLGKKKNAEVYEKHKQAVYSKEHINHGSLFRKLVTAFFRWETFFVKRRISLPFGGSIIIVANKKS